MQSARLFPEIGENEAIVLMGHGTAHPSNMAYHALDYAFSLRGYDRVYIGMVEGEPGNILRFSLRSRKMVLQKITLMPLMLVAGNHAEEDMAGDEEDSWKRILMEAGYEVDVVMRGIGEEKAVRRIYIETCKSSKIYL